MLGLDLTCPCNSRSRARPLRCTAGVCELFAVTDVEERAAVCASTQTTALATTAFIGGCHGCVHSRANLSRASLSWVADTLFLTFAWAVAAWATVAADRLGIVAPVDGETAPEPTLVGEGVA